MRLLSVVIYYLLDISIYVGFMFEIHNIQVWQPFF